MIYFELFLSFLQIGLFSIGGGYAAMPLIESQVVDKYGWMNLSEFTDLVTIAEMTPGPIAVNAATFVGTRVAGLTGAITATVSCILPSIVIVSLLALAYKKFKGASLLESVLSTLRPAVVALIAGAGLSILMLVLFGGERIDFSSFNIVGLVLFVLAFVMIRKFKLNPILAMCLCGAANLIIGLVQK